MAAVETIDKVLQSGVLKKSLTYIPARGATSQELDALRLGRPISSFHRSILARWNGINLDVLRLYGASPGVGELRSLDEAKQGPLAAIPGAIVFGDDPSGFVYAEVDTGQVLALNTSTNSIVQIANSLDDFIDRVVFGSDAASFAGSEWVTELSRAGLV